MSNALAMILPQSWSAAGLDGEKGDDDAGIPCLPGEKCGADPEEQPGRVDGPVAQIARRSRCEQALILVAFCGRICIHFGHCAVSLAAGCFPRYQRGWL